MSPEEDDRSPEARLAAIGLALPKVSRAARRLCAGGAHRQTTCTRPGSSRSSTGSCWPRGKVGADIGAAEAAALARTCALNALAAVASVTGGLDAVRRIVKVIGFVASAPDFTQQAQVINGASELLIEVFGEAGRHARSAVGMAVLPLDAPVEVELIAEVRD